MRGPQLQRPRPLTRGVVALLLGSTTVLGAGDEGVVDLRAAALLMSGQEGGELRPAAAVRWDEGSANGEPTLVVGVRVPSGAAVQLETPDGEVSERKGGSPSPLEVFVYSLSADLEVLGRAAWTLGPGQEEMLLAARLAGVDAGEVRLLVRQGSRLGLSRVGIPARDAPELWWIPPADAAVLSASPDGAPLLVPDPEPDARAALVVPADLDVVALEFVGATGRSQRVPVEEAGEWPSAGRRLVRAGEAPSVGAVESVAAIVGEGSVDLGRWRETGDAVAESGEKLEVAPPAPVDLATARREWRRAALAWQRGGTPEALIEVERGVLEVGEPRDFLALADGSGLEESAALGLALLRLETIGLHAERAGGFAASSLAGDAVLRVAGELASGGAAALAADLATAVARERLAQGSRRGTREALESAVEWEEDADRRLALGVLAEKGGDVRGAEEHFRRAAELDPARSETRLRLGVRALRRGRVEAGRERLAPLVSGGEDVPEWVRILALEEWARVTAPESPGEAVLRLRRGLGRHPDHPRLRLGLVWALDLAGRGAEADVELDRVLSARPRGELGRERARYNEWPRRALEGSRGRLEDRRPEARKALVAAWAGVEPEGER